MGSSFFSFPVVLEAVGFLLNGLEELEFSFGVVQGLVLGSEDHDDLLLEIVLFWFHFAVPVILDVVVSSPGQVP